MLRLFPLENTSAKDVADLLAQGLELDTTVVVGDDDHLLVVRGRADRVEAAAALVEALDRPRAEVDLDLELLLLEGGNLDAVMPLPSGTEDAAPWPRRLAPDQLERLRAAGRSLAAPSLTAFDRGQAQWRMVQELIVDAGDELATVAGGLGLTLFSRVHAAGEVTVEVTTTWTDTATAPDDATRKLLTAKTLAGEWSARLEPGEALVVAGVLPPPGSRGRIAAALLGDAAGGELVLVVAPRVARGREIQESDLEIICAGAGDSIDVCRDAAQSQP